MRPAEVLQPPIMPLPVLHPVVQSEFLSNSGSREALGEEMLEIVG